MELLYLEGCPNHEAAAELVRRVAHATGIPVEIERVDVPDDEAAARLRFLGSPTIRVDGHDVEPGADARTQFQHACRVYRTASGLRGAPYEAWVRDALRKATGIDPGGGRI
ncbi:MAG: DF family (seleno)protein [Gaiellaceae bacterium]